MLMYKPIMKGTFIQMAKKWKEKKKRNKKQNNPPKKQFNVALQKTLSLSTGQTCGSFLSHDKPTVHDLIK